LRERRNVANLARNDDAGLQLGARDLYETRHTAVVDDPGGGQLRGADLEPYELDLLRRLLALLRSGRVDRPGPSLLRALEEFGQLDFLVQIDHSLTYTSPA